MIIYKTTNLINGKIYIGQDSKNNSNYFGSGDLIKLAIKKYGKENFTKEILHFCQNQLELDEFERYYIKEYDSINKEIGYNIAIGGRNGATLNRKLSEITKKRISNSNKGKKLTEKHKENLSKSHKGKKISGNTKKKMSDNSPYRGIKKEPLTNDVKNKISVSKRGKIMSSETKKKMSEAHTGSKNHFYGRSHSDETLIKRRKPIIQMDINNKIICEWKGVNEAAKYLKLSNSNITSVLKGRYKTTGGFKFKYKYEES